MSWLSRLACAPLIALVRVYQLTVSRLLPAGICRFEPSCSQYALQALRRRGLIVGLWLIAWRVLRCQPFCQSGHDPVPERGWRPTILGASRGRAE